MKLKLRSDLMLRILIIIIMDYNFVKVVIIMNFKILKLILIKIF